MQASYKRDLNHNYLILSGDNEVDAEAYQVRLLMVNPPKRLLRCMMHTVDNQVLFYYEVTAKQSLASIYERNKINREGLQVLFGELIKNIEEMESHLLNAGCLLLHPEYIYLDAERKHAFFCFFPGEESDITGSFRGLAEYLLPKIDHTDQAAVTLGYSIYRRSMENTVYLEQIKKELYQEAIEPQKEISSDMEAEELWEQDSLEKEILQSFFVEEDEKATAHPAISTIVTAVTGVLLFGYFYFINNTQFSWQIYVGAAVGLFFLAGISAIMYLLKGRKNKGQIKEKKDKDEKVYIKGNKTTLKRADKRAKENVDEEIRKEKYLDNKELMSDMEEKENIEDNQHVYQEQGKNTAGETMVLAVEKTQKWPCLIGIYPAGLQPILINKEVFVLGKLESIADAMLPSPAVSRVHAKIVKEEEYCIYDLNSRNGTFVNHNPVAGNQRYILQEGDEITLGDLTYSLKFN